MPYTLQDVTRAKARLNSEVGREVQIDEFDYGWGLRVLHPDRHREFMIYRPQIDDRGQSEFIGDLDEIIRQLKRVKGT